MLDWNLATVLVPYKSNLNDGVKRPIATEPLPASITFAPSEAPFVVFTYKVLQALNALLCAKTPALEL